MGEKYIWKNTPRIITYANPCNISSNPEVMRIISSYPHLCASDTLLMGLVNKYSRSKFTFLSTIERFIDHLFDGIVNSKEADLHRFVEITKSIEAMKPLENENTYKALMNNRGELVNAFKMLTLLQYEWINETEINEQNIFLKYIYKPNADRYIGEYRKKVALVSEEKCRYAFKKCLKHDVKFYTKIEEKQWKDISKIIDEMSSHGNKTAELYKNIINEADDYPIDTVVLHGVARFTPEIMMLIRALDEIGIKIIFLINYVDNLPGVYDFWKKAYAWVGVEFENVSSLSLDIGNVVGRNIAKICNGVRTNDKAFAELVKYSTITDFTDSSVRTEFIKAQRKAKEKNTQNVLAHMNTQYYAVAADRPNDILRHYFPEQFIDKPFLAYPIGQFIKSLFSMWDFEKMALTIDFNALKECAAVRIGHNNDRMIQIIDKIKLYFKDTTEVDEVNDRALELISNIGSFEEREKKVFAYLSYFAVDMSDVEALRDYIQELNGIAKTIFESDKEQQYDFRKKFKELVTIVQNNAATENALSQKENELLIILINSLDEVRSQQIVGAVRELRDALSFFLSIKKDNSSADWIVRGFDQIDGAPLMRIPPGRTYEFSMMSMKNMTKTTADIFPWPLNENVFSKKIGYSVFMEQMKNIVELRNEYLRFYLFYGAFFSRGAHIRFSYIENDHEQKQRPYYLLDLLNLTPVQNTAHTGENKYEVVDSLDTSVMIEQNVSKRELELFSICPYKYFLTSILNNELTYSSEYHTNYYIENEMVNLVEIDSKYNVRNINNSLRRIKAYIKKICPYIDDATLRDMDKFVRKNYGNKKREEIFLRRKRDFLIAAWKDFEKNINYMKYDKNEMDVEQYLRSSSLAPSSSVCPHNKICEECNYNELCLNYYLDKEVEE